MVTDKLVRLAAVLMAASAFCAYGHTVKINGSSVGTASSGDGWSLSGTEVTFAGAGPFVLSGSATGDALHFVAAANCTVVLSNLTVTCEANCPLKVNSGKTLTVRLYGTNKLTGGTYKAGLGVSAEASVVIDKCAGLTDAKGTLTATPGNWAAGIGGNRGESAGNITILGGTVTATGSMDGAAIGGGCWGDGGVVTISGGVVKATVGTNRSGAGIGGGGNGWGNDASSGSGGDSGKITISGGTVTASAHCGAGIGGGYYYGHVNQQILISGGTVTASSASGAAIGSGYSGMGGYSESVCVKITGGTVTATGDDGAAIGGGYSSSGHYVVITGGKITAKNRDGSAGIGGGYGGSAGTVKISGGTVYAKGGGRSPYYGAGIGGSHYGPGSTVVISGGSVYAVSGGGDAQAIGHGSANSNSGTLRNASGQNVYLRTIATGLSDGSAVTLTGLGSYGVNDIYAQNGGNVYLYLLQGDPAEPKVIVLPSITIGGVSLSGGATSGAGWTRSEDVVTLTGAGPYLFAGSDTKGSVTFAVNASSTLNLSSMSLTQNARCSFSVKSGVTATVNLSGANRFAAVDGSPAIRVPSGATLIVDKASGVTDSSASLTVSGAMKAAGIGSAYSENAGSVTIRGGTVTSTGGSYGAGIGSGYGGKCSGTISVEGGVVKATGGQYAAGIGGGYDLTTAGAVRISGGTVTATGGEDGAGIGTGYCTAGSYDNTGSVTVSGGTVTASGKEGGAGIGGGYGRDGLPVTISGGTVTATSSSAGAGIGGGYGGDGISMTISGGRITAESKATGAGIGGGYGSNGGSVSISGGTITAKGGCRTDYAYSGAGIGGGSGDGTGRNLGGYGATVVITGGSIYARGGGYDAEDIGHGNDSSTSGTIRDASGKSVSRVDLQSGTTDGVSVSFGLKNYGEKDVVTQNGGYVYYYLPQEAQADAVTAALVGSADETTLGKVNDLCGSDDARRESVQTWLRKHDVKADRINESAYLKASLALDVAPIVSSEDVKIELPDSGSQGAISGDGVLSVRVSVGNDTVQNAAILDMIQFTEDLGDWDRPSGATKQIADGVISITPPSSAKRGFIRVQVPQD